MRERLWIPQGIASILLFWALNDANPYGYYKFLRIVCFGIFTFLSFRAVAQQRETWAWLFGLTAALYNPFIPIHLNRDIWSVINLVTVGIALASIFVIRKPPPPSLEAE